MSRYPAPARNDDQGYLPESYRPPSHRTTMMNGRRGHYSNGNDILSSSSSTSSISDTSSSSPYDSDDSELLELQAAEREWEENARQLQLAVSVLILPTIGKWLGRRWSYWCKSPTLAHTGNTALIDLTPLHPVYAQYIKVGWKWTLFIPESWLKRVIT